MNRISIGGIIDTVEFVVGFGLLHLSAKKYPESFIYEYHDMTDSQYWHWLNELNRANGWKHKSNFIAWYEYKYGGPKSLIGDLELFAEYMYDEYGVRVPLSHSKMKALAQAFREEKKMKGLHEAVSLSKRLLRRVSVVFEGHPGAGLLCREIVSHKYVNDEDGIELTLFNTVPFMDKYTIYLHDDLVGLPAQGMGHRSVKVAKNLAQAARNCDLLIFMGNDTNTNEPGKLTDFLRDAELKSLGTFWMKMGSMVNELAENPDMRVVFTCMKYPCFNATFFIHAAPILSPDLVVAVTHDIALHPLVYLSRASGIPMASILQRTAHVWGSPGISHIVDLGNTDAIYNRPNMEEVLKTTKELKNEIVWNKGNPFENLELEDNLAWVKLDPVDDMLQNTWKYVSLEKEKITCSSGREPYVASVRATMEILSHWYADEVPGVPVSVGICSTGGYGIPKGLVFSVPALVKDDRRRGWYDFHWCYKCRIIWDIDRRPRWTETQCKRKSCFENPTPTQICCHYRNPEIFLPGDPLLDINDVINTVITTFYELDGKGEILSKILEKDDMKQFLTTSGKLVNFYKPTRPLVDDYAAKIRKELSELDKEWDKFVGKNSHPVYRPKVPTLWKHNARRKKMSKSKKKLEKLQQAEEEEEEGDRKDYDATGEDVEQEAEVSAEELSVEEPESREKQLEQAKSATETRAHLDEETGGEGRVYKLKRRLKEEEELDKRAKKVIEAITEDDIPILRLYPNPPNVPKDIMEYRKDWLNNTELRRKAELHFDKLGDERPSIKFRREYYAKRLAQIEHFCKEVVPKEYGHLYCTHTKAQHKKMEEEIVNSQISLIPYPPPVLTEVFIDRFVPPEPELGEDDATYQTRWVEARMKYDRKCKEEAERTQDNTLYYGHSSVRVQIVDDMEEALEDLGLKKKGGNTNGTAK